MLGVQHRELGVQHRGLGVQHRGLGVQHRVLGVAHVSDWAARSRLSNAETHTIFIGLTGHSSRGLTGPGDRPSHTRKRWRGGFGVTGGSVHAPSLTNQASNVSTEALHRLLGVLHRVLGVLHRVLGVQHRVLGVQHRVVGVVHRQATHSTKQQATSDAPHALCPVSQEEGCRNVAPYCLCE